MTKISAQIKYDTQFPEHKKHADKEIKYKMTQALGELVLENREGIICISPIQWDEFPEFDWRATSTIRLSAEYQFAHSFPVYVHEGFEYKNELVRPPYTLKFWERVKFVFTGDYPK